MRLAVILATYFSTAASLGAEMPSPSQYFCSMTRANIAVNGESTFEDLYAKHKRPNLVAIPKTGEANIIAEGISEDGRLYSYIKSSGEGIKSHMIHGIFDFKDKTLITARSILFPTDDGGWITESTSFVHLCEEK